MFTSFVDTKILAQWEEEADENLTLFDSRVQQLRHKLGASMVRTPIYEQTPPFIETRQFLGSSQTFSLEDLISRREEALDYIVPKPHAIAGAPQYPIYDGTMPPLNGDLFETESWRSPMPSPWKQRHRYLRPRTISEVSRLLVFGLGESCSWTKITGHLTLMA
jgi:hypothetical protein